MKGVDPGVATCRQVSRLDTIALFALLLVAAAPVGTAIVLGRAEPATGAARVRLTAEIENRRVLADGIPLWSPYQFGGRPHLADRQTLAFYPPHVLLRWVPVGLFFPISLAFHAWLAGTGAYLAARYIGIGRVASWCGGAAVGLAVVFPLTAEALYTLDRYWIAWLSLAAAFGVRSVRRLTVLPHPLLVLTLLSAVLAVSWRELAYVLAALVGGYTFALLWLDQWRPAARRAVGQLGLVVCLTAGLSAFQVVPSWRLHEARASAHEDRSLESAIDAVAGTAFDTRFASLAAPMLRGGRAFSTCEKVVDSDQLLAHGVPSPGGRGGLLLPDYATFASLALGVEDAPHGMISGLARIGDRSARSDLLAFMDIDYLVSCDRPDPERWTPIVRIGSGAIYRNLRTLGRAVWTCAPRPVSRDELIDRLRHYSYDATLTLRPRVMIHVRWAADVAAPDRERAEGSFRLVPERLLGDRTWQYELRDESQLNVAAIVTSRMVEDTAGIDRHTFAVSGVVRPRTPVLGGAEWLIGAEPCPQARRATVTAQDRTDGMLMATVDAPADGLLFLSEPYTSERVALVDGRQVATLKVNLAFTGVPVPAGPHQVELRYAAVPFRVGAAASLLTASLWLFGEWRFRRRIRFAGGAPQSGKMAPSARNRPAVQREPMLDLAAEQPEDR